MIISFIFHGKIRYKLLASTLDFTSWHMFFYTIFLFKFFFFEINKFYHDDDFLATGNIQNVKTWEISSPFSFFCK